MRRVPTARATPALEDGWRSTSQPWKETEQPTMQRMVQIGAWRRIVAASARPTRGARQPVLEALRRIVASSRQLRSLECAVFLLALPWPRAAGAPVARTIAAWRAGGQRAIGRSSLWECTASVGLVGCASGGGWRAILWGRHSNRQCRSLSPSSSARRSSAELPARQQQDGKWRDGKGRRGRTAQHERHRNTQHQPRRPRLALANKRAARAAGLCCAR